MGNLVKIDDLTIRQRNKNENYQKQKNITDAIARDLPRLDTCLL